MCRKWTLTAKFHLGKYLGLEFWLPSYWDHKIPKEMASGVIKHACKWKSCEGWLYQEKDYSSIFFIFGVVFLSGAAFIFEVLLIFPSPLLLGPLHSWSCLWQFFPFLALLYFVVIFILMSFLFLGLFSFLRSSSKIVSFHGTESYHTNKQGRISPEVCWCYQA